VLDRSVVLHNLHSVPSSHQLHKPHHHNVSRTDLKSAGPPTRESITYGTGGGRSKTIPVGL
jgi:hypothetical protein